MRKYKGYPGNENKWDDIDDGDCPLDDPPECCDCPIAGKCDACKLEQEDEI
jgi:hypothetical protein